MNTFYLGRMVCPDKRKGLLYVYQSDDSLMHFCWQDRTTGIVEDDLIIFPDDCEYIKVSQCTTGRVYLLKFKSSNRKFFFWLQVLQVIFIPISVLIINCCRNLALTKTTRIASASTNCWTTRLVRCSRLSRPTKTYNLCSIICRNLSWCSCSGAA